MNGFLPDGYVPLLDYIHRHGDAEKIGRALASGELKAAVCWYDGRIIGIDPGRWRTHQARRMIEHGSLLDNQGFPDRSQTILIDTNLAKTADVVPFRAASDARLSAVTAAPNTKGGRPLKHDWAALAGWITAYILEHDYPDRQSEVVDVAINWFKRQQKAAPDIRDVERFVSAIYEGRRQFNGKTGEM